MVNQNNIISDFSERLGKLVRRVANAIVKLAKEIWSRFKHILRIEMNAKLQFVKRYEKGVARHKQNQHTRSTWRVSWNTRKYNQWMNHKPAFAIRKF